MLPAASSASRVLSLIMEASNLLRVECIPTGRVQRSPSLIGLTPSIKALVYSSGAVPRQVNQAQQVAACWALKGSPALLREPTPMESLRHLLAPSRRPQLLF